MKRSDSLSLIRCTPEGQAKRRIEDEPRCFFFADSSDVWVTARSGVPESVRERLENGIGPPQMDQVLTGGIGFKGKRYTEDVTKYLLLNQTRSGNQAMHNVSMAYQQAVIFGEDHHQVLVGTFLSSLKIPSLVPLTHATSVPGCTSNHHV